MAAALGMFGLKTVNQKVEITASNPLWDDVPVSCGATLSCSGSDYTSVPVPSLDNFTLKARANNELIATQELPASVTAPLTSVSFSKLTLDLPANPVSQISDKKGNLFFAFSFRYICGLAVGETFSLPLKDMSTGDINLPIGKYKVKKCEVSVELESTVPLAVSIDNVRALKPAFAEGEEPAVDDNLVITSGFTIDGGSLEHPATSTIKLEIEALEGTVPDISSLLIDLTVAAQPGLGDVALSGKQGIRSAVSRGSVLRAPGSCADRAAPLLHSAPRRGFAGSAAECLHRTTGRRGRGIYVRHYPRRLQSEAQNTCKRAVPRPFL